jgi:hypothetical protein
MPVGAGEPVGLGCLDLVSLDTMYQFNPNFGLLAEYSPPTGSAGGAAEAHGGVACSWVQQTSGETIEIAVARPSKSALADLRAAAGSDESFSSAGGAGQVQSFSGPYWVSATSTYFFEAGDARPLVDSVKAALR